MEVVILIHFDIDTHLGQSAVEKLHLAVGCVTCCVTLAKGDLIELLDILNVINCEALFEFFRQLFNMLFITNGQDYSRDVVVLAGCQLFTHSADANYLTKCSDLSSHGEIGSHWFACRR